MKITKVIYEQLYPVINEPYFNVRLGGEVEIDDIRCDNIQEAYAYLKSEADKFHRDNWPHMYHDGVLATQPKIIDKETIGTDEDIYALMDKCTTADELKQYKLVAAQKGTTNDFYWKKLNSFNSGKTCQHEWYSESEFFQNPTCKKCGAYKP